MPSEPIRQAAPSGVSHAEAAQPAEAPEQALVAALDCFAHAMFALRPDATLIHANRAAAELLQQGWPFLLTPYQKLRPQRQAWRAPFTAALREAGAGQPQPLHWVEKSGEESLRSVHAVLRPMSGHGAQPVVRGVLLLVSPAPDTVFDISGFAATYRLSKAETRVLEALMHGDQAEEAAQRLQVGVSTVRSQIAAIRKKAGYDSVSSLLAALGSLPVLRRERRRGE